MDRIHGKICNNILHEEYQCEYMEFGDRFYLELFVNKNSEYLATT